MFDLPRIISSFVSQLPLKQHRGIRTGPPHALRGLVATLPKVRAPSGPTDVVDVLPNENIKGGRASPLR